MRCCRPSRMVPPPRWWRLRPTSPRRRRPVGSGCRATPAWSRGCRKPGGSITSAKGAAGEFWAVIEVGAGLTVEPVDSLDVTRPLARVTFTDAVVPDGHVLGGIDTDLVRDLHVTVRAAEAAGIARWAQETATAYAKVREQFGRPIGSFQSIKHLCSDLLARSELAAAAAWDAASAGDDRTSRAASMPRTAASSGWLPRPPGPSRCRTPSSTPRTASRSSVASASPGSTTLTSRCGARWRCELCPAAPDSGTPGCRRWDARASAPSFGHHRRRGRAAAPAGTSSPRLPAHRTESPPGGAGRGRAHRPSLAQAVWAGGESGRAARHRPGIGSRRGTPARPRHR